MIMISEVIAKLRSMAQGPSGGSVDAGATEKPSLPQLESSFGDLLNQVSLACTVLSADLKSLLAKHDNSEGG